MKIRTITLGFNGTTPADQAVLLNNAEILEQARAMFEQAGYEVQTIRMATQPWEIYIHTDKELSSAIAEYDQFCTDSNIEYINVGTTFDSNNVSKLLDINKKSTHLFSTAMLSENNIINYDACFETAKLIKNLAPLEPEGFANLRFAAVFNLSANCPFFPAAYHDGKISIGIGTENSDLVYNAFEKAGDITRASDHLNRILEKDYSSLQTLANTFCKKQKIWYNGIDPSICTSINPKESIAFAFEHLGLGKFGGPGTLAVARIITSSLKALKIKKCGYSGLMLPVMEDFGLAQRNNEGQFGITDLLVYSAVCGTGLDTIPLPGDIETNELYALLLDLASLSCKLQKPLSARLMPVPTKTSGDMTEFDFPYFVNTKIMSF